MKCVVKWEERQCILRQCFPFECAPGAVQTTKHMFSGNILEYHEECNDDLELCYTFKISKRKELVLNETTYGACQHNGGVIEVKYIEIDGEVILGAEDNEQDNT